MPEPLPQDLAQANELVQRIIGEVNEPMICGFLPLSQTQEDAVILQVRKEIDGFFARPLALMRIAPAAIAYALAAAPSRTLTNGGHFWSSLEIDLGLVVPINDRAEFSAGYLHLCKRLGLVAGTIPEASWIHAAPFIFQAGILHHWSDNLAAGIKSALRISPAPDIMDEPALRKFSDLLATVVHGQPTLVRLLGTEVGPLMVRRLVKSYVKGNWSTLPPHLQQPMQEAFKEVGQNLSLRSPFVRYDEAHGRIELALPRQHDNIMTPSTVWMVGDVRYSARAERALLLEELPSEPRLKISLDGLARGFRKQEFEIQAQWTDQPFRLFRQENGRERSLDFEFAAMHFATGRYIAVLPSGTISNRDGDGVERKGFVELAFDLRPGAAPIQIQQAERKWSLSAELKAGVFLDRTRASTITAIDGIEVHYGDVLGLVAYVPAEGLSKPTLHVTLRGKNLVSHAILVAGIKREGVFAYSTELESHFAEFRRQLPAGIHYLHLDCSCETGSCTHQFIYWCGLLDESPYLGFECTEWPGNIDLPGCKGLVKKGLRLCPEPGYNAPTCVIALGGGVEPVILPRLGVKAVVIEPEYGTEDEASPHIPLVVDERDQRVAAFSAGGSRSWALRVGGRDIATLTPERPRYAISLAGLAQEVGGSGRVEGFCEGLQPVRLLTFVRPLACRSPFQTFDNERNLECWKFQLPEKGLTALAIQATELTDEPDALPAAPVLIALRDASGTLQLYPQDFETEPIAITVAPKDGGHLAVTVSIRIADIADRLILLDVLRKGQESDEWELIDTVERTGYAKMRIVVRGTSPAPPEANWWRRLKRQEYYADGTPNTLQAGERLWQLAPIDLDRALARATDLMSFKYPGEVWNKGAKPFRDLVPNLARHRYLSTGEIATVWWRRGSIELVQHVEEVVTPFVRNFILSTNPALLGLAGQQMGAPIGQGGLVDRCLNLPSVVHMSGGLGKYLIPIFHRGTISPDVYLSFKSFSNVVAGKAQELTDFQVGLFILGYGAGYPSLSARVTAIQDRRIARESVGLLSAEHYVLAIKALNRRARPLQSASQSEETHSLTYAAQTLMQVSSGFHRAAPILSQLPYHIPNTIQDWIPPLLETPWGEHLAKMALIVAGLARAEAAGWRDRTAANKELIDLLGGRDASPAVMQKNMSILLSLAPELFAFYFALFSLAYSNH